MMWMATSKSELRSRRSHRRRRVVSQDTQYTAVSSMQYGVVARCGVCCIADFRVCGIDGFEGVVVVLLCIVWGKKYLKKT